MRIVLAPDSFTESMTAEQAAAAMGRGVHAVLPDARCVRVPMADGGEGTVTAMTAALGGRLREVAALDALGRPARACYGVVDAQDLAVVEVATAIGLARIPPAVRDVRASTSAGVGLLLLDALDQGARRVVVGLGGTATDDGGAGMLRVLGAVLRDGEGRPVPDGDVGALGRVVTVDLSGLDPRLAGLDLAVACDVTNPLLGPDGATAVFGPQKGVTPQIAPLLEAGLTHLGAALEAAVGRALVDTPGAGAGGGLGAALLAVGARIVPGFELVASTVGLAELVCDADLVLTGEGSIDAQTARGKTPAGVASIARAAGVPVLAFGGRVLDPGPLVELGVAAVVTITPPGTDHATALAEGPANLERAVAEAVAAWVAG
ncbi:MAG TPA: glycerate kinase [Actinotalea sp.]|nr:glycerate kinase [Actinotalea sp.]